jgi:hypothetical protein
MIDIDLVRRRVASLNNEAEHGRLSTDRFNDAAVAANYSLFLEYLGLPEQYADASMAKGKISWPETRILHEHLRPFTRHTTLSLSAGGLIDLSATAPDVFMPVSLHRRLYVKSGETPPCCDCQHIESTPQYDIYTQEIDLVRPHHLSYRLGSAIKPVSQWPIYTIEGSAEGGYQARVWPAQAIPVVEMQYLIRPPEPRWVASATTDLDAIEIYDPAASTQFAWDAVLIDAVANRIAASAARHANNLGKLQAADLRIREGR